jgi:hypothetical protein
MYTHNSNKFSVKGSELMASSNAICPLCQQPDPAAVHPESGSAALLQVGSMLVSFLPPLTQCFIYQPKVWYPPLVWTWSCCRWVPIFVVLLDQLSSQNCKLLLQPPTFPLLRTPDVCKICKLLQCSGCLDSQSGLRALAQVKANGLSCRFCIRSSFFHRHSLPQYMYWFPRALIGNLGGPSPPLKLITHWDSALQLLGWEPQPYQPWLQLCPRVLPFLVLAHLRSYLLPHLFLPVNLKLIINGLLFYGDHHYQFMDRPCGFLESLLSGQHVFNVR